MARLLLGVSGGIAAYKALETTRLAIKAGHSVRVIQTEASLRFVGPDSFAGDHRSAGPVPGFDPDPLRGAFPGDPPPARTPISHLALAENADVLLIAPASANTIAKLAHGHADNLLTRGCARRPRSRADRAGHEQPDVRASGHPGQPRAPQRSRRDRHRPGRGGAGLLRRVRGGADGRTGRAPGRRRGLTGR